MPEAVVAAAELDGRPQPLVGEGRRHADVDHGHVGPVPLDRPPQRVGVAHGVGDDEAPIGQELDQAVAQDGRVLGDDDPQRTGERSSRRAAAGPR